ncbi:Hypothetical predicted protein [Lecanosticta acicola]|uniref:Glutaminase A n=1 Tax=Lecanosticta acicola TaxID=111012 RepID=A0AAI8Z7E7_9PEZI|nr:Hypothetical predicted protein [Lecanosticta acicola]
MRFSSLLVAGTATLASAQSSTFSPLRPPAIPLAVKSPYLSTWQQAGSDGGNGGYLPGEWPTFWQGQVTGWCGMIRVDNATYTWMGNPANTKSYANQTAFSYTSTQSIFTLSAGPVQMVVTFLSGVTPNDLLRSSLPYSYMNVDVKSLDGKTHSVQLYTDISAEWVSGDHGATAQWSYGTITGDSMPIQNLAATSGISYHKVYRQQQLQFSETNQQADWGYWYWATKSSAQLTHQSGADNTVRGNFMASGHLPNTNDTNYRAINNDYPVFGFASNLGSVGSTTQSVLYQLSLHQQNCIQFEGQLNTVSSLPCMWTNYFSTDTDAVNYFYNDYSTATSLANSLDSKIASDSNSAGGSDYNSITALATRQAFGALEYTNTPTQPLIFLKEISSDGNVNTVDVIFPFHPIAIYMNATILKYVLDPLFINQENGNWPYAYSIHDIGSSYPNATGHNDGNDESQPLEECGDMLIMTLAYAQRANDNAYLTQHYAILKQWTGYLVQEALIPANQISTDDFAGAAPNQTNLAIKGIIGIEAMAQIANRTGHTTDGQNYTKIAHDYITKWQGYAVNSNATPPHTTFNYNNASSFSLLYNIFGDMELGLQLVPQSIYDMQSTFYNTKFNTYGVPLDSRHSYTKGDWEIWCASVASSAVKSKFISTIANWLNVTPTNFAFTDWYDTISGDYPSSPFIARPVVGGMYAPLALNSKPSSGYVDPS